jgi:hypothetical protein
VRRVVHGRACLPERERAVAGKDVDVEREARASDPEQPLDVAAAIVGGVPPVATTVAEPLVSDITRRLLTVWLPKPDNEFTDVVLVYVIDEAVELE